MTKPEFITGWTLLTTQPWGKPYRGTTPEATIQIEFYYRHVSRANPVVWMAVCEHAAQGQKWPSLDELKQSLANNGGYRDSSVLALASTGYQPGDKPEALAACFRYQEDNNCSLKDAYIAVLPVWIRQNKSHAESERCEHLLSKAKENFGIPRGKEGNLKVVV